MSNPKTCPFGHTCDQCILYVEMTGVKQATQEPWVRRQCAIVWNVELMSENARITNTVGAAIESFRNEMVDGNQQLVEHVARQQLTGRNHGDPS